MLKVVFHAEDAIQENFAVTLELKVKLCVKDFPLPFIDFQFSTAYYALNIFSILNTSRVYTALHGKCAVLRRASSTWQIHLTYVFNLD